MKTPSARCKRAGSVGALITLVNLQSLRMLSSLDLKSELG